MRRAGGLGRYAVTRTRIPIPRTPRIPMGRMTVRRLNLPLYINNTSVEGVPTISTTETNVNALLTLGTPALSNGAGYNIPFAMKFSLSQLVNYTELTNVFDQYRILGVKVFVSYQHNVSTAGGTSSLPSLQYFPDFDDNTPPTSAQAVRERMGVITKRYSADRVCFAMSVRPRPIFTAGTAMVPYGTWYDCQTNPNENHYGIKGIINNVNLPPSSTIATSFKFDVQYVVQFRTLT